MAHLSSPPAMSPSSAKKALTTPSEKRQRIGGESDSNSVDFTKVKKEKESLRRERDREKRDPY
jgi:hypothetical protein